MVDRFELILLSQDREPIYALPLDEDVFERFVVDTWFTGVRKESLHPKASWRAEVRQVVEGESRVASGFLVRILEDGGTAFQRPYSMASLQKLAERLSPELVRRGTLSPGAVFHYLLLADPESGSAHPEGGVPRTLDMPVPSELNRNAVEVGEGEEAEDGLPVLVAPKVLDQALKHACASPGQEVGGALIGRLCRHNGSLWAQVEDQLPARHVEAAEASLRFTAGTWMEILDALAARGRREQLMGWWHSHPFRHPQAGRTGDGAGVQGRSPNCFLSEDDQFLHETFFANPWQVALVVDPVAGQEQWPYALFGWQGGLVAERRFGCPAERGEQ
jgi:hypothetical protein